MHRFSADSRLSEIALVAPASAERLAALDSTLRRILGGPLSAAGADWTIQDAAGSIGIPAIDLLAVVNGCSSNACAAALLDRVDGDAPPGWLREFDARSAATIDVRPLLAQQGDPFGAVMRLAEAAAHLIIDAPFDPIPLRRILGRKAFETTARRLDVAHWRIWCRRSTAPSSPAPNPETDTAPRTWEQRDGVHIDVRGLAAPAPLVAILQLIDGGSCGDTVIVHHYREPSFLFPELAERGWSAARLPGQPDEFVYRLSRSATP